MHYNLKQLLVGVADWPMPPLQRELLAILRRCPAYHRDDLRPVLDRLAELTIVAVTDRIRADAIKLLNERLGEFRDRISARERANINRVLQAMFRRLMVSDRMPIVKKPL
jgi:hypothetical protein